VPAIAVTAHAMTHQIEEYFAAGFDGYIAKPFRAEALATEIARVVSRGPDGAQL
jgi:CheY-like chemotaxis protein